MAKEIEAKAAVSGERVKMRNKIKHTVFDDAGNKIGVDIYEKLKPKHQGVNKEKYRSFGKDPETKKERTYILIEEKRNRRKAALSAESLKRKGDYSKKSKSGKGSPYKNPCKSSGASGDASESCGPNK